MEANADSYITVDRARRSGPAGQPDPGRARHGRRPDQLRRDQPRGAAAGHRADHRDRTRACSGRSSSWGDFYAGTFDPGPRALAALKAAGQTAERAADQLADRASSAPTAAGPSRTRPSAEGAPRAPPNCRARTPDDVTRPQGLAAQGALTSGVRPSASRFYTAGRTPTADGATYPNSAANPRDDRLAVDRLGDPGPAGAGPVADELHLHQLGAITRQRAACPSW